MRCPLAALGYRTHFHTIRSHEKLTSEGMTFLGHDLIRLVEEVLPAQFGGGPTDYQFVEVERDGLPRVDLLVSPRLGPLNEPAVAAAVLDFLDHIPGRRRSISATAGARAARWPSVAPTTHTAASKVLACTSSSRARCSDATRTRPQMIATRPRHVSRRHEHPAASPRGVAHGKFRLTCGR